MVAVVEVLVVVVVVVVPTAQQCQSNPYPKLRVSGCAGETSSKLEESEVQKGEMPRRRIAGKRTVEDDAHVPAKKERAECTSRSAAVCGYRPGTATANAEEKTSC